MKKLLYLLLGIVAVLVIAAISLALLFDPNDYRDNIAEAVREETGRELVIEGDLELSFFPWLAINMGRTRLGNAPGFGDEPFLSFEEARLSVRVWPILLRREVAVGTAALDGFELNLEIGADGRSNWQDLLESGEAAPGPKEEAPEAAAATLDIASIRISDAAVSYEDAQAGEAYRLSDFNLETGNIGSGAVIPLSAGFDFELQPANFTGDVAIEMEVDRDAGTIGIPDIELTVLDIAVSAVVEPFSYVDDVNPVATIGVDAFSLKSVMTQLGMEPPVTADPDALGKVILDARLEKKPDVISLTDVQLVVDDTTFTGSLDLAAGIAFKLAGDEIDLGRYMEPADAAATAGQDQVPVEIPIDLIRALDLQGALTLEKALLSGMAFENVTLGVNVANGNLRMHPISADFFNGKYEGDVRINAAGATPSISVDENIVDVDLGALAIAMFEQQDITGAINGSFRLTGQGNDLAAIQRSLDGNITMELTDGAWEGTDLWYELRRARALFKQEAPPEPRLPARTKFSNVRASGPVTDGVFRNDDLFAELPFMQLTGRGTVDFPAAELDYRVTARVLEQPEFIDAASAEELEDFTEAEIPIRITGPLTDPSIAPDIEELLKREIEEEIKDVLLDKLLGGDEDSEEETDDGEEKKKDKDKLEDALKDLLRRD